MNISFVKPTILYLTKISKMEKDIEALYEKCYDGYHKVDDIRFKLLSFFPLGSGLTIGSIFIKNESGQSALLPYHLAIGIFGIAVSIGLLIYELKGIEKCTQFIFLGAWIEVNKMKDNKIDEYPKGYFIQLLKGSAIITEPLASAFIYSIVLAAWTYVMLFDSGSSNYGIPVMAFCLSFISIILYWKFQCVNKNDNEFRISGKIKGIKH